MRNGYRVYDSDTHIGPSAETLEKYLSSRVRELVPDLEGRKVPQRKHSTGREYDPPYPTRFRLSRGEAVGGWGADVPRVPHPETRFPESVDLALNWKEVNPDLMRKILWDNAVKAFGAP